MRINIVIDDVVMADAVKATGLKTKREAVELGRRTLVALRRQADIRQFRGRLGWQGDLDAIRSPDDLIVTPIRQDVGRAE